jgi:hypothetical protein
MGRLEGPAPLPVSFSLLDPQKIYLYYPISTAQVAKEKRKMYVIKAIYPHGGHTIANENGPLSFSTKEEAHTFAEQLTAENRTFLKKYEWNPNPQTTYIVVEDYL